MTTGIVLILVGMALTFWVGRISFGRRNEAGVEQFANYGARVVSKSIERVVLILGRLLLLIGLVVVGLHWLFHA